MRLVVAQGAMLSHGNRVASVLQVAAWVSPNLNDGAETLVKRLPIHQVFALTGGLSFFSTGPVWARPGAERWALCEGRAGIEGAVGTG